MAGALVPLVPLVPVVRSDAALRSGSRARADFVAHLIATSAQAPQTRSRRRAEPRDAAAAYAARNQAPSLTGIELSRSL
jgi:hypothetical protein